MDTDTPTPFRRFGLRDLLFLVATCAIGIGVCRYFDPDWSRLGNRYGNMRYMRTVAAVFTFAMFVLIAFGSLPLQRAVRYPGRSSILAIVFVFPFVALTEWTTIFVLLDQTIWTAVRKFVVLTLSQSHPYVPAYCAVSSWTILGLRRDAIWSRDWTEIACLVISLFWVAFAVLYFFIAEYESWIEELA